MMRQCSRTAFVVAAVWLAVVVAVHSQPVRRAPSMEARRRSAVDRSLIRFGRSYPAEPSAAEIRETLQRSTRAGNSFLRFGRSQPLTFTTDDLISMLRSYEDDYEEPLTKRASSAFVRFGRDPKFIRLGRSIDEDKALGYEQTSDLVVSGNPKMVGRAKDREFIRVGRDTEVLGEEVEEVERTKRAACQDCH